MQTAFPVTSHNPHSFKSDGGSMYALVARDWKELSKAASQEHDPKKLLELVNELNEALKQLENKYQAPGGDKPPDE
jgi:hypothetical protein